MLSSRSDSISQFHIRFEGETSAYRLSNIAYRFHCFHCFHCFFNFIIIIITMADGRRDPDRLHPWDISRGTTGLPTSGSPTGYRPTAGTATSRRDDDQEPPLTWILVGFFAAVLVVCLVALWIVQRCRGGNEGVVQLLHNGISFSLAALRLLLRI